MESQRVRLDWATEVNWYINNIYCLSKCQLYITVLSTIVTMSYIRSLALFILNSFCILLSVFTYQPFSPSPTTTFLLSTSVSSTSFLFLLSSRCKLTIQYFYFFVWFISWLNIMLSKIIHVISTWEFPSFLRLNNIAIFIFMYAFI